MDRTGPDNAPSLRQWLLDLDRLHSSYLLLATLVAAAVALAILYKTGGLGCAHMFIDLERYEVERGYKAVHNPLKGQELALHLGRYGPRVGVPLLVAATAGVIGGFALLNQGLYETVGRGWFRLGKDVAEPA